MNMESNTNIAWSYIHTAGLIYVDCLGQQLLSHVNLMVDELRETVGGGEGFMPFEDNFTSKDAHLQKLV